MKIDNQPLAADAAPIQRVEIRQLALPTGIPSFVLPNGHRTPTELCALLVRVVDADGAAGQSLLWGQRPPQLDLFEAGIRHVAEAVVGRPTTDISSIVLAMRQTAAFVGTVGATAFAISGFEMALQDLRCRRLGVNLADSLGRVHQEIRAYQTGLMLPSTIDELVAEAARIQDRGIRAVKMLVGRPTVAEDIERVRAVRDSLPADVALMVDALQRWTLADALKAADELAAFDLVWIEDPLPHQDLAAYRNLIERSPVQIATGETCFSRDEFVRLLDVGVPYIIAELERVGGISGWMDIAQLVHESGAVMLSHLYPHVSAQMIAALPQVETWWEYVPWFDQLVDGSLAIVDGMMQPERSVGSGFDPSPDAIERFATTPWISVR